MPPPTPLLAGRPTSVTQSPAALYIPQVVITDSTRSLVAESRSRSPVIGCTPLSARVAAIRLRSRQSTSIEHCRKYTPRVVGGSSSRIP
jgi:hypothetical protein